MFWLEKNLNDKSQVKELNNIKDDDLILDIGPKTINKIKDIIEISKNNFVEWTCWLF